jgi:hypothetical protein
LKAENGWRKVEADGVNFIEPEIFMVQNRFNVVQGKEIQFEQVRMIDITNGFCERKLKNNSF